MILIVVVQVLAFSGGLVVYFQSKLYLISSPHIEYNYLSIIIHKPNISISIRGRGPERKITIRTIHIFLWNVQECVCIEVPLSELLKQLCLLPDSQLL